MRPVTCPLVITPASLAPAIRRIQGKKPDVVWSVLVGGAHIAFYRQFEATIGKKNMIHNDATPDIEVDPETYEVRADGELLTCPPAEVLPLAQRYFMF